MVDEAHERSLATDLLLGLLKKIQGKRKDLRVIVASATLQAKKIAEFFDLSTSKSEKFKKPALLSVEGRSYGVQASLFFKVILKIFLTQFEPPLVWEYCHQDSAIACHCWKYLKIQVECETMSPCFSREITNKLGFESPRSYMIHFILEEFL